MWKVYGNILYLLHLLLTEMFDLEKKTRVIPKHCIDD